MNNIEMAGIEEAVISVVLSRAGMRRYRNADPLELDPSDLREIVRLTVAQVESHRSTNASPQGDDLRDIYTCIGKGGEYELIGDATGAGETRNGLTVRVYRDTASGTLYYRTRPDFDTRMERVGAACRASAGAADALTVSVPVEAYLWLMGMGRDGFVEDRRGAFWWRGAFNERAGLDMMGIYEASKAAARNTQPGGAA